MPACPNFAYESKVKKVVCITALGRRGFMAIFTCVPIVLRIIEVYIRYLRLKLEANNEKRLLQTVRSVGYVLCDRTALASLKCLMIASANWEHLSGSTGGSSNRAKS